MSSPIQNIIVVMLENRSYDNVLGSLYSSNNQAPYKTAPSGQSGLNGLNQSPTPSNHLKPEDPKSETFKVFPSPDTTTPAIDPGEAFTYMAQQILGLNSPPSVFTDPNPYSNGLGSTPMQGFVASYASQSGVPAGNAGDVMTYLTPMQIPMTAFLANNFAVCDSWYGSAPCQTFTNRVFSVCAAPGMSAGFATSFVDDLEYLFGSAESKVANIASIFSQLDYTSACSPPTWKVYFHDYSITAWSVPYVYNAATTAPNINVATFDDSDWGESWNTGNSPPYMIPQTTVAGIPLGPYGELALDTNNSPATTPTTFLQDLQNGTLPAFSLIEPRYANNVAAISNPPNSNHPGSAQYLSTSAAPPIDVANGEALLATIYNALVNSSYWQQSLLIVVYDEHGGMFDHQAPPTATSPGTTYPLSSGSTPGASKTVPNALGGFDFDYYGPRVPAIIVSPYISAGSTLVPPSGSYFDHSSIVRTVWNNFLSSSSLTSLTARDANAPDIIQSLNASGLWLKSASNTPSATVLAAITPSQIAAISSGSSSVQVTLSGVNLSGYDNLSVSPSTGLTASYDASSGVVTITAAAAGTYTINLSNGSSTAINSLLLTVT